MKSHPPHTVHRSFGALASPLDEAALPVWSGRAVLLVDLDAFFASVEQHDHPEWRGKPLIVGGDPNKRGVVSTASYEARTFGVHSAMPSSTAARLCPEAIWCRGNFHRYREVSKQVMDILYAESPLLMQVSIDEAFLDVTPTRANPEHPVLIAKRIQDRVDELGVTCSIGVGTCKSVAKIASDLEKPHGITAIWPGDEQAFLSPLPTAVMSGIGPVAQDKLARFGIRTLGDVARADVALLKQVFGKNAQMMQDRCRGIDTPVDENHRPAKSVSNETSLAVSVGDRADVEALIATMAHKVGRRLRTKRIEGTTLHLKLRFEDLHFRSVQRKESDLGTNDLAWLPLLYSMLDEIWREGELVRLVGVGVSGFDEEPVQTRLFDLDEGTTAPKRTALTANAKNKEKLLQAGDAIAKRFGEDAVRFGHELRTYRATTGSSTKNPEDYKD